MLVIFPFDRRVKLARRAAAELLAKRGSPQATKRIVAKFEINTVLQLRAIGVSEHEIGRQLILLAGAIQREITRLERKTA